MTTDLYNYLITAPAVGFDATRSAALTALQTAIGASADARLYPMVLAEGCDLPACRYQMIDTVQGHVLEGHNEGLYASRVQIDVYSTKRAETASLAQNLKDALDGLTDTTLGTTPINGLLLDNELESYEDGRKLHVRTLDFIVLYN
jgi:hypothetical protein